MRWNGLGGGRIDGILLCLSILGFAQQHPPRRAACITGVCNDTVNHLAYVHTKRAELMEQVLLGRGGEGGRLKIGKL